nr:uncharacterized protein LOC123753221 [Procambarus clarkii]
MVGHVCGSPLVLLGSSTRRRACVDRSRSWALNAALILRTSQEDAGLQEVSVIPSRCAATARGTRTESAVRGKYAASLSFSCEEERRKLENSRIILKKNVYLLPAANGTSSSTCGQWDVIFYLRPGGGGVIYLWPGGRDLLPVAWGSISSSCAQGDFIFNMHPGEFSSPMRVLIRFNF